MADDARAGRLGTRLPPVDRTSVRRLDRRSAAGSHELPLGGVHRAWLHVPVTATPERSLPLVVALHGAGGQAHGMLTMLQDVADSHGVLVLALQSTGTTWDVIQGGYGPDVRLIDAALKHVLGRYAVDPARLAIAGFSDGASYALSLGIANGDLFGRVLAWSPGFAAPQVENGRPRIYVSHGIRDRVLPIDRCSRRLVPALRSAGYDVTYEEFDGPHEVPSDVLDRSIAWPVQAEDTSHSP